MNRLHREHGAQCAEQHDAGRAHGSQAPRADRLVQARAKQAIQRRGRDLPRGSTEVLRLQGDSNLLLQQLDVWGVGLALQAGALPPDFEAWGWAGSINDQIEDGLVSRQDVQLRKTVMGVGQSHSTWSIKVDFKIEGEHRVGKGKGDSDYSHTSGRKSTTSRGTSSSRGRGAGVKVGNSAGSEDSMGSESGMDLGVGGEKSPVKLGVSGKDSFGHKETRGSSSEISASSESSEGSNASDTSEVSDGDTRSGKFRAEKSVKAARIVANVDLQLDHTHVNMVEGEFEKVPIKKKKFSVYAGDVKFMEDSNIAE